MQLSNENADTKRYLIQLSGIVQGVGFRPYIYRKAKEYQIYGWVNNAGANVVVDVEGNKAALRHFVQDIVKSPPTLAVVEKTEIKQMQCIGYTCFEIRLSNVEPGKLKRISPDMGVCDKCMEEAFNPASRRYRYGFTNCTECGPRYSIIEALPYDRCHTTMKDFVMCDDCKQEYYSPESRRFHTQPNCCSVCGPKYWLTDREGNEVEGLDFIRKAVELLKEGSILAIKGIGGFHLCCDAKNRTAVTELRRRKNRPDKPLAVMMESLAAVNEYCELSEFEQRILTSQNAPIVLLKKKTRGDFTDHLAPCQIRLGVLLPFHPIPYLLFMSGIEALVVTSGNRSGSSIQYENQAALKELGDIADYFLIHNRNIHHPVDDSVVKVIHSRMVVSRRARGYIPYVLDVESKHEIVAVGAEQKSTFCIAQNGCAHLSQYLGDLKDMDSFDQYKLVLKNFMDLMHSRPAIYVHDLHPQYLSTGYAKEQQGIQISVQHHHAHMASCMAEHKLFEKTIGVIFDGTGFGTDGSIWGGEFLAGDRKSFLRVGYLKPVLLQGGDSSVKDPWKTAVSYLSSIGYDARNYLDTVNKADIEIVQQALVSGLNCHWSSSMGRFFDCVAALLGIREHTTYDGQAAIELETMISPGVELKYDYCISSTNNAYIFNYESTLSSILSDIENKVSASIISAKFHNTISKAVVDITCSIRDKNGMNNVVLSGGVFENTYLLESVRQELQDKGFKVYFNEQIPINDSGVSMGQLAVACEVMKEC